MVQLLLYFALAFGDPSPRGEDVSDTHPDRKKIEILAVSYLHAFWTKNLKELRMLCTPEFFSLIESSINQIQRPKKETLAKLRIVQTPSTLLMQMDLRNAQGKIHVARSESWYHLILNGNEYRISSFSSDWDPLNN